MTISTPQDQAQVNECAREYTRLVQERNDRLEKAIIEAQMWLNVGEYERVRGVLFQALNS